MIEVKDDHGRLMDDVYRHQRLIYDLTRKYYLLGRDHLIAEMSPRREDRILELACGTGRNLSLIARRYPGRPLYGLDISEQMLATARRKLGGTATLAQGDACTFDPVATFGPSEFDHIVLSYAISMIPDWRGAISHAVTMLAPGGTLQIVDFGDQARLPHWFARALRDWLRRFHVAPRDGLLNMLDALKKQPPLTVHFCPLYRSYAQYARITRS